MITIDEFLALLGLNTALAHAVGLHVSAKSIRCETRDDHAAHAVEMLALRKGLQVRSTFLEDGRYRVNLRGFIARSA